MVVKWAMRGNFTLSGTKAARPKVENNTSLAQATSLGTWKQLVLNAAQTSALLLAPSSPGNLVRGRPCNVLFIRESIDPNHKDTFLLPTPVINLLAMSTKIICSVSPPLFFFGWGCMRRKFGATPSASCPRLQFKKVDAENC